MWAVLKTAIKLFRTRTQFVAWQWGKRLIDTQRELFERWFVLKIPRSAAAMAEK
jgi:hypothetical protein